MRYLLIAVVFLFTSCEALLHLSKGLEVAEEILSEPTGAGILTNEEVVQGLKQALKKGVETGVEKVSITDGFFSNVEIKIPFPPEVKEVEDKARQFGFGNQVDEFVLTLNRAAELASKEAKPIFVEAITSMSITDAMGLLKGNQDAATRFLENTTRQQLFEKFQPVIHDAIEKVEVTKYWNPVINAYNFIPGVEKKNPNLDEYVTDRALNGLFIMIEKEEREIRENPLARTTDLLKKVFGGV